MPQENTIVNMADVCILFTLSICLKTYDRLNFGIYTATPAFPSKSKVDSKSNIDDKTISVYIYIISEETSIFALQRIPFYKDPRVAACTVGKVRSSTVFMCVCSTFRPSDFLLFVKNGFVMGVRCQGNREPPADGATTPLSQRHSWLGSP